MSPFSCDPPLVFSDYSLTCVNAQSVSAHSFKNSIYFQCQKTPLAIIFRSDKKTEIYKMNPTSADDTALDTFIRNKFDVKP